MAKRRKDISVISRSSDVEYAALPLSYAQNMEDMHLDALFAEQESGFYLDVGAGHPVADNVSLRSYLRGWRGVVVEPQTGLHRLYGRVRPRDAALDCLIGRSEGQAAFHEVDRLHGFSTMVEDHARGAASFGAGYATHRREMRTLASICAEHAPERIDWLKIDVEGAEAEVLAGNDWTRHRPRVVLVEAVAPGTMAPSHEAWEPILLEAGYGFVFFDGLNRFYVADEEQALAARAPRGYRDWGTARHLFDHGRAPERRDHPDHALAVALQGLSMADLPLVDPEVLFGFLTKNLPPGALTEPATSASLDRFARLWLGGEPWRLDVNEQVGAPLEKGLRAMIASDAFRAALGRIAAAYDGGFILDD